MFIVNVIFGAIIGIANIIPGLSGGTMAVILNMYDKLVGAVSRFKDDVKGNIKFLAAIGIGALGAIVLFSNLIDYLLETQYMLTNFFFIGIIVGSLPLIFKHATKEKFNPLSLIPCIITFGIMIAMIFIRPDEAAQQAQTALTLPLAIQLFFFSAFAAICMIIPGISGSFIMLLLGVYTTIIQAISDFNLIMLIPVGLGILTGLLLGAKIIDFLLRRFPQATYFAILGLVVGSVPVMYNQIVAQGEMRGGGYIVIAIVLVIIAAALTLTFDSPKLKAYFEKLHSKKK